MDALRWTSRDLEVMSDDGGWTRYELIERDKEFKLKLYSRHGVQEYWIVSWQLKAV